jgi:hypothetical protein
MPEQRSCRRALPGFLQDALRIIVKEAFGGPPFWKIEPVRPGKTQAGGVLPAAFPLRDRWQDVIYPYIPSILKRQTRQYAYSQL